MSRDIEQERLTINELVSIEHTKDIVSEVPEFAHLEQPLLELLCTWKPKPGEWRTKPKLKGGKE